ncbi:MAG: hypothetical protein HC802_15515 [Caldilineaceae bacterium]|nr:hypothetical protein [Caldilineaceae bacterium]
MHSAPTPVSPDIGLCDDCRLELLDPADRRFRYPFINCTNCGPRFTILRDIPYDRPMTTMDSFTLCAACRAEYDSPSDRRFHAQPNACSACGPQLQYRHSGSPEQIAAIGDDALRLAQSELLAGRIVAIKGLGRLYTWPVMTANDAAVARLRARKGRDAKPLAVMARDLHAVGNQQQVLRLDVQVLERMIRVQKVQCIRDVAQVGQRIDADGAGRR